MDGNGNVIDWILVLGPGETPREYRQSPGEYSGLWGVTVDEAVALYESETGQRVERSWLRGSTLWVCPEALEAGQ